MTKTAATVGAFSTIDAAARTIDAAFSGINTPLLRQRCWRPARPLVLFPPSMLQRCTVDAAFSGIVTAFSGNDPEVRCDGCAFFRHQCQSVTRSIPPTAATAPKRDGAFAPSFRHRASIDPVIPRLASLSDARSDLAGRGGRGFLRRTIPFMARAVEELYQQASRLPTEDRAELAGLLLESIEEPDEGVEQAWAVEIERRLEDYRAGRVKTIPWSEVRARLHRSDR